MAIQEAAQRPDFPEIKQRLLQFASENFQCSADEALRLRHTKERALLDQILPPKVHTTGSLTAAMWGAIKSFAVNPLGPISKLMRHDATAYTHEHQHCCLLSVFLLLQIEHVLFPTQIDRHACNQHRYHCSASTPEVVHCKTAGLHIALTKPLCLPSTLCVVCFLICVLCFPHSTRCDATRCGATLSLCGNGAGVSSTKGGPSS